MLRKTFDHVLSYRCSVVQGIGARLRPDGNCNSVACDAITIAHPACPVSVGSTVSHRSDTRAGAKASQHPPGDGRHCQRVRFGPYTRSPNFAPAPVLCSASALASQGRRTAYIWTTVPAYAGFTPVPYATTVCQLPCR